MIFWSKNDPRQIFLDGADWYIFIICGNATPSKEDLAPIIIEAERRFPNGKLEDNGHR